MTQDMFKEDWWPMTSPAKKFQTQWCRNRGINNVRYRDGNGWKVLDNGDSVSACMAEPTARDMQEGRVKTRWVRDI